MLLTRSPLHDRPRAGSPFDLHVLGTPPAFILSQDRTLRSKKALQNKFSVLPESLIDKDRPGVSPGLRKFDSSSVPVSGSQGARPAIWAGQRLISSPLDHRLCMKRQLNMLRATRPEVKENISNIGVYTFPTKSDAPIILTHKMMGASLV